MAEITVVIDATKRFAAKKPMPPNVDPPPWTRTSDEAPSVKTLPFTSREWSNEHWPTSMWADVPTSDHAADKERGKLFAQLTISAMIADQPTFRPLEVIFESMIKDAIQRRAKGGKGSRLMPAAVHGYLETLATFITVHCRKA